MYCYHHIDDLWSSNIRSLVNLLKIIFYILQSLLLHRCWLWFPIQLRMWSKLITSYNQILCNIVAKLKIQRTFEERHVFKYWLSIQERKIPLRIVLIKYLSFEAAFFFCITEILQVLCFSKLTLFNSQANKHQISWSYFL